MKSGPVRYLLVLVGFGVLVVLLAAGLRHDPRQLPSALIGQRAPNFDLPRLAEPGAPGERLSADALRGQVWILNVWASWCESCRDEHRTLEQLAGRHVVPVYGLDYKDDPANARQWLADAGNPYTASLVDRDGQTGIDFGVYGVPETFVVDRAGVIRYRHAGPLTNALVDSTILPLVQTLQQDPS
ncbi:DsbE family thiol:disulfide interchange protein [Paraburkholderia dinghuensis]|uniref:DsbE family thiol:disulfide interchange protein n=1 Tax=Paraburkholderia dinghuensis TaxID=2305225 RepID=A0A3N6MPH9_9BURK|nr:DsbE family thiol:disulfide interchange protein [Paraburkholderia dinghuensis]RQH03635.1 DsbE family thiol:disulfide interchange protein [Paraburkholderia dinghuensis]